METYIALVAYGCTVAGHPSDDVDFQVRLFQARSIEAVDQELRAEPTHQYENDDGQAVTWPLAAILDIQLLHRHPENGAEVAGAITSLPHLSRYLPGSAV